MGVLVELQNVSKQFALPSRGSVEVLRGVSLQIPKNTSISITGESGSGKSTLLHLIGGLDQPSEGHILWNGRTIDHNSINQNAKLRRGFMSFVLQSANLIPEFTALENVLFALRILQGTLKKGDEMRAQKLLDQLGVLYCEGKNPANLSGGERQRIAIARALMTNPQILIADEPTGNLDEVNAQNVMRLLRQLCQENGASLLLVTHNPEFAQQLDRSYQLCDHTLI